MLKSSTKPTRVLVFGTFDGLHKGHDYFFKQARKLSRRPYLIVSLARDVNVKKIKGRKPVNSELKRLQKVAAHPRVDKAVLGQKRGFLSHILKLKPQIIALGYDQTAYTKNLSRRLARAGLRVKTARLKPFKPHLYKSSLIKPGH